MLLLTSPARQLPPAHLHSHKEVHTKDLVLTGQRKTSSCCCSSSVPLCALSSVRLPAKIGKRTGQELMVTPSVSLLPGWLGSLRADLAFCHISSHTQSDESKLSNLGREECSRCSPRKHGSGAGGALLLILGR